MRRNERLYPISEEKFNEAVLPVTEASYRGKGRPPEVSRCRAFCGILYILRTGCPRRGLPEEYGYWRAAYGRFNRGSERGLQAKALLAPQKEAGIAFNGVIASTALTMTVRE